MSLEYRSPTSDELPSVLGATFSAFGAEMKDDDLDRERQLMPLDRVLAAWDAGQPVGTTASWPFELTVPGGTVRAAGVTWCGVLPSHRRRGVLSELINRQLHDVASRGEPLAILWASEAPIYGRFGFGVAAPELSMDAERAAFALRDDPGPAGSIRLVDAEEALEIFPAVYESVRAERPGFLSRSEDWWRLALLADPEHWRDGAGPKFYALLEIDGEPAGYAVYRVTSKWEEHTPRGELRPTEVLATTAEASMELWRYLFGIDLVARVKCARLDPAWSPFLMVVDPRRLHVSITEGLWLRFADLEAALRGRRFGDGASVVLEVVDDVLVGNAGRWEIGPEPRRTDAEPDVVLGVADLASAYLGAFSFEQLGMAGRARELRPDGLRRASALFATSLPPYCPEGF